MGEPRRYFFGVVVGQAHVALLVNRIVEQLARVRSDGHRRGVKVWVAENRVEAHAAPAAPAPHADPSRVRVGPEFEQSAHARRLILRRKNAHLSEGQLAPLTPARDRRAAVFNAGDDVALLRQHPMPQPAAPSPSVAHGLTRRLTIHVDQQRMLYGRIQPRRFETPRIERNPVADVHLQ